MVTIIVLSAVLAVMLIAFFSFYWYSRTPEWGDSETRKALLRMLVVVGPIFGMHYDKPVPERPTIATPKIDDDEPATGIEMSTPEAHEP